MVTMTDTRSDEELVDELKLEPEVNAGAFDELVVRHQSKVLANCRYLSRSPDDAEDLAQEVFVKAYYGLRRFEARSTFRTWLHRIKINHCLNFLEKNKRKIHVDIEDAAAAGHKALRSRSNADARLKSRTDRERIGEVLDQLSDTVRLPLILRDMDGLSYQEIADEIGVGLSAVKMRIKRGREEFRDLWHEQEAPAPEMEESAP